MLVTASDDFNALAAYELRRDLGHEHVYRLPAGDHVLDLVPAYAEGSTLFHEDLTYSELTRRFDAGAELVESDGAPGDHLTTLFVIGESGELTVVTAGRPPVSRPGDTKICLRTPG